MQNVQPVPLRPSSEPRVTDPRRTLSSLHWYIQPVRRFAPLIFIVALAVGLGSYFYEAKVVKPTYQATATEEVDVPAGIGSLGSSVLDSQEYAPTAAAIIHSWPVAAHALKMIKGYPTNPTFYPGLESALAGLKLPADVVARIESTNPPFLSSHLLSITTVSPQPNSQNVQIAVTSTSPALSTIVANAMGLAGSVYEQQLQASAFQRKLAAENNQITFYQGQIKILRLAHHGNGPRARALEDDISKVRADLVTRQASEAESANQFLESIPASVPTSPVGPHPLRTAVLAGVVVAALLMSIIILREYFATTLRTPEEVTEAAGGAPVLGAILRLGSNRLGGAIVANDPRGVTAEGLRVIRTNLLFSNVDHAPRVVLLTSARQGEGKTTISSNLAATMAELGGRVLIIDADLRRPSLNRVFNIQERTGLTNALLAAPGEPVDAFIHRVEAQSLSVLPSGPVPPNPAELLSSGRMRELLHRLSTVYDTIILDSPPILAVADPAILATMVDAVILVADVNQLTLQGASRTREAMERVGTQFAGVVLNKLSDDQRGSYYYNYYYRNDYAYGYSSSDGRSKKRKEARKSASSPPPPPPVVS